MGTGLSGDTTLRTVGVCFQRSPYLSGGQCRAFIDAEINRRIERRKRRSAAAVFRGAERRSWLAFQDRAMPAYSTGQHEAAPVAPFDAFLSLPACVSGIGSHELVYFARHGGYV